MKHLLNLYRRISRKGRLERARARHEKLSASFESKSIYDPSRRAIHGFMQDELHNIMRLERGL